MNNLPHISVCDIPGNRPEDQKWDEFCEWAIERMSQAELTISELREALEFGIQIEEGRLQKVRARAQQQERENRLAQEIDERSTS